VIRIFRYLQSAEEGPSTPGHRISIGLIDQNTSDLLDVVYAVYELVTVIEDHIGTRNWCYALDEESIRGLDNIEITENRPSWARRLDGKTTGSA
jgi:hypothetical protein